MNTACVENLQPVLTGRRAYACLSGAALLHNLACVRRQAPHAKVIAMIKANAYGHGIRSCARILCEEVDAFGVAHIDEAMILRAIGISTDIILMEGVYSTVELDLLLKNRCAMVCHNQEQLDWLENYDLQTPLFVWVKVDTGMGRLGFQPEMLGEVFARIHRMPQISKPFGLMSHFACANDHAHPLNQTQRRKFAALLDSFQGPVSICNSAAIWNFSDNHYDYVRPGIALYGVSPSSKNVDDCNLRPVMTLKSKLIAIKTISSGQSIGYDATYVCTRDMRVGVVAIGYGDGYPRDVGDGAVVLIQSKRCAILGKVSMDMLVVDLSACLDAVIGTEVVLWGEGLPIAAVAAATGRCTYELLCSVQHRVKFYWDEK